ncbi:MAG: hypothetical protein RMA76_28110 [Deltaproteobacteria bacterium]|jgi:hypothetical protein
MSVDAPTNTRTTFQPTQTIAELDEPHGDAAPLETPAAPEIEAPSITRRRPATSLVEAAREARRILEQTIRDRIEQKNPVPEANEVPFGDRPVEERRADLETARTDFEATGDPAAFDDVDTFRANLTPEDQAAYDAYLDEVRSDDRINFRYEDGATPDAALEELTFRGIAAETFGRPEALDRMIETASNHELDEVPDFAGDDQSNGVVRDVDGTGTFDVYVFPPERDLGYSGGAPASGDLTLRSDALYGHLVDQGDNLVIHELAHVEQGASLDGGRHDKGVVPHDFPDPERFDELVASEDVQGLLAEQGLNADGLEAYPTMLKLFTEDPEALRTASPEMFQLLSDYLGYRPDVHTFI